MGEYLELISDTLNDAEIRALLANNLAAHPRLLQQLSVGDGVVSTKLATCEHIFFSFAEMVALNRFIETHADQFRLGPRHDNNATPREILQTRRSLYMPPIEHPRSRRVPDAAAHEIDHRKIWRKTKRVQSKNGTWYHKRYRRDETTGIPANPNGRRVDCPNAQRTFRAIEVGNAWDAHINHGRTLYRCPRCDALFNLGETPTPQHEQLARRLHAEG